MPSDTTHGDSKTVTDILVLPAALQELADNGDAELVEELIAMFQVDTTSRLEVLQQALATRDYVVVNAEAHTIKGSASQMGAVQLAAICQEMEWEARKDTPHDLTGTMRRIVSSFEEVCLAIASRGGQSSS